jgi:hypothetical protein
MNELCARSILDIPACRAPSAGTDPTIARSASVQDLGRVDGLQRLSCVPHHCWELYQSSMSFRTWSFA